MNYFERVFQELWLQIKEQILYRKCLTEQTFLSKSTIGCLWNFCFLEVCVNLVSNFTCKIQFLKESRAESYSIELTGAMEMCSKIGVFKILGELQENTHTEIQLQIIGCNLAKCPQTSDPKFAYGSCAFVYGNCAFDVLDVAFCMFISRFFPPGMKVGVKKFRNYIEFGLQSSLRVHQLYFILHLLETG